MIIHMAVLATIIRGIVRFVSEADAFLLALSTGSAIFGLILINSVTHNRSNEVYVQVGAVIIGIALYVLFSYVDIDIIADKSKLVFIFSILFLSTLFVWGEGIGEGRGSWLRFGAIGIQPGEIIKIPFIIIISYMISNFKERRTFNSLLSMMQIVVVFLFFVGFVFFAGRDVGTMVVYMGIFAIVLFAGGTKLRWFLISGAILTLLTPFLWENFLREDQRNRILAPFIPDVIDPTRRYQLWQGDLSVQAIATGGWFGQGLGNGRLTQTIDSIPAQHTDFIFSVVGEELGFIGCIAVLALLVTIIIRCVYIGIKSNNSLGMLVCIGVAAMVLVHMIMNVGMALGIMPVIGVPLPFISYGGSSVVTFFAAMGLVSGIKMRPKPIRFRNM
ncbi:MAG: FtsW/RodA/SpoVE family cell cycle protein [Oscillospiraceae bacterium]|nr:FtsW/RodA/SpoVE family cell cycle protein [Oscillospiraceae bacterium]